MIEITESAKYLNSHACLAKLTNEKAFSRSNIEQMEAVTAIEQVFQYYQLTLENKPEFQSFVKTSSRIPLTLKSATLIGACDRTLGIKIPMGRTVSGGAIRGLLKRVGLITTTGGEYFRGCVVFVSRNANHQINSAIGVRYGARIRAHEKVMITWQLPTADEYKRKAIARAKESFNEQTY